MPAALLPKKEVVDKLLAVFRECGYEGTSLARMSEATGLVKASLYHYFPQGKEQMAGAVFDHAVEWISEHIISPLKSQQPPRKRIAVMVKNLDKLYKGGLESCIIDVLVHGMARKTFQGRVKQALEGWIAALTQAIIDGGLPPTQARKRAEEAVVKIEGAIIVSRGLDRNAPFKKVLGEIAERILKK